MTSKVLIVTFPHRAGAQYLPALPHYDFIDTAARGIIHPIILQRQPALHTAEDFARFGQGPGQGVEPNINVAHKLRAGL